MAFEFNDTNFKENVEDNSGVTVIDFWAEWCGPCRLVAPIIEDLSNEYDGKALVGKLDVDNNPEVSFKLGIRSIPTIMIFKGGKVVDKHIGTLTKQALKEKIDNFLN